MSGWNEAELEQVATNDEIRLAVDNRDDTAGNPVTMWAVAVDGEVYIRAVRGHSSPWYRRACEMKTAMFQVGSLHLPVTISEIGNEHEAEIDAAYREKYQRYAQNIVDSTVSDIAREATLKLEPAGQR